MGILAHDFNILSEYTVSVLRVDVISLKKKNDNKEEYRMSIQSRDTANAPVEALATQKLVVRPSVGSLLQNINAYVSSRSLLLAFFTMFWLLNGLDKFLNRHPFWFGTARDAKFVDYFARIHLPAQMALTTLYSFGVLEILLGVSFALSLLIGRRIRPVLGQISFKVSILMFFAYSIGDILFGDRAELLEHGTYLALIIVCFAFFLWKDTK